MEYFFIYDFILCRMLSPDGHSFCQNDDEQNFGIFIRDGSGDFAVIYSPFVGLFFNAFSFMIGFFFLLNVLIFFLLFL